MIIDQNNHVVGQGYNGVPSGMLHCSAGGCPRFLNDVEPNAPYDHGPGLCMAAHAEQNALAHGDGTRFAESTLYVNMAPCFACARQVAGAGIRRIVYLQRGDRMCNTVTVNFLDSAQVEVESVNDLSNYPS